MKKGKRIGKQLLCLIVAFVMVMTLIPRMPASFAYAAANDVPDHDKILTQNDDGTYTIALNVKGDSEKQIQKVNVIVIVDRSGSMGEGSGTGAYVPTNSTGTGLYGLIDAQYVPLERRGTAGNRTFWYNGTQYTGQRYEYDRYATRLEATQQAVNGLADTLLGYNGKDGNPNDTVEMALVSFATTAQTNISSTTSASSYIAAVNGLNANGGTNWEAGLNQANNINFGDNDPTYVIFFSDGAPTFRTTQAGYNDRYQTGVYGSGQEEEPNMERAYTQATDDAEAIATKIGKDHFYTIFAYGGSAGRTYMTNLTSAAGAPMANNYSASDSAQLNAAFAEILEAIEMAGIGAVSMEDGTTSSVETTTGEISHLLTVDENSYKYYRAGGTKDGAEKYDSTANGGLGEEWEDAPEATFTNGAVKWDLKDEGVLENNVTYTVTFDCWPSQTTLDIVADIKNDPSAYDKLDENIKKYIDKDGNLKTNTTATLSYTDTRTGKSNSEDYDNPEPVQTTAVEELAVSKEWENELDDQAAEPITLTVTRDGDPKYTVELSRETDPAWTKSVFISVGILRTTDNVVEVLEKGHDFTFTEPADLGYYWELDVPTVRPMLVNGVLTMLILKDATHTNPDKAAEYTIDGKTYYVGATGEAALTATNNRRARLNLTKLVDGPDADPDQTFPFTLNMVDSKASEGSADDISSDYYVWFSVYNGGYVDAVVSGAEKEMKDGSWTGYYYAPSGTDVVVNLKANDNLRFLNLPTGSTYTFTEGTLPDNYAFTKSVLSGGEDNTFKGAQTTTGTIQSTNTDYTVTYTNTYELSDIEITKVWEDNKNQDGMRPTADEFKSNLVLKADGTDVTSANANKLTVTDNKDNTYTVKWTGLDRYTNGKEITYTVEETAIDGYTTTGSPAQDKGTITNSHTPETVDVKVVKDWQDSEDIGKIRPASINVQLTADGTASGDPVALNENGQWTYTWEELPKYKAGTEIVYSADETAVPAGYDKTGPEKTVAEDGTITFTVTNKYNPTPVSVDPPVQKIITNNTDLYNKGDFTFTIEAVTEGAPMPENTEITNTAAYELENKKGFYEFGNITFTMPGEYEYKITESGEVDGVTNDSAAEEGKTIKFTVTDDGTGKLAVTPTTDQVQLAFTNVYDADGEATLVVSKEIAGAAWPANKTLTLTVAGSEGAPMPEETTETLTAAGSVEFGPIAYGLNDAGKTYTYTISEDGFGKGWTGSGDVTATVKVTDNGDGTLKTEVTYSPENATITNTYKATGTAAIEVTKAVSGAAWPAGKTLNLTLAGTESAPMPAEGGEKAALTAAGKATFGAITYTEADAGKTYTYTISEDGFGKGWTGSGDVTATVKVTDNGDGTLKTEVTYSPENDTITNTYTATGSATLEVTKAVTGAEWPAGKTLTLTLAGEGGTLPETKTATLTAAGKATFGAITYTEADAGKTYTYTISEDGFGKGWTGSGNVTATVKVTDNGDGTLKTEVTYSPENDTITNTYNASGTATLEVTKAITGAAWPAGKTLNLSLTGKDNAPMPAEGGEKAALTAAGKATFGTITYSEADAGKTYTYTISEDGFGAGWTGSGDVTATVKVTDNGDGSLGTEVTYTPNATITNTYKATGKATLTADKVLTGREWQEGETVTFTLLGPDGKKIEDKTIGQNGTVTFSDITYTEADAGKTYNYTISETSELPGGVIKSADITATVKVTDNGDGTLKTEVTYTNDDKITNTYSAQQVKANIKVTKTIDGYIEGEDKNGNVVDRTFDFTMTGPKIEDKLSTRLTTQGGEGEASFADIVYTFDDMVDEKGNRVTQKDFVYTVTETDAGDNGFTYDSETHTVTVTVTDDQNGKLVTSVNYGEEETSVDVVNVFEEEAAKVTLHLHKTIDDQSASAKDGTFTFQLKDAEGKVLQTKEIATKDLEGDVNFDELTFTKAGTYNYTLSEQKGNVPGMTYDEKSYPVVITVSDNFETAVLEKGTTIDGEETTDLTIVNVYKAESTKYQLAVTKKIEDTSGSAYDTTFEFTLTGPDSYTETTSIVGPGTATFKEIPVEKAGTYEYTIQETKGDAKGYTYDTGVYKVTVTVVDNNGKLEATATYKDAEGNDQTSLTVTNTYDPEDAKIVLKARKVVDDKTGGATNKNFTFELVDADGKVISTKSIQGGGYVYFDEQTYDKVGEYKYNIHEVKGSDKGYTYDTDDYPVTVTVTDPDKDGILKASATEGAEIVITNEYKADPVSKKIELTKELTGRDQNEGEFSFTLTDVTGEEPEVIETVTNTADGAVVFSEIEYTVSGEYVYEITEEVPEEAKGVTYDQKAITVTVNVTDDGEGALAAEVVYPEEKAFKNEYHATGTFTPEATKELKGATLTDGQFTFKIEGDKLPAAATATNKADGTITFGEISYDETDIGKTYEYTITEVNDKKANFKYDDGKVTLKVTIADNGDGTLKVTGDYGKKTSFTNTYEEPPVKTGDTTPIVEYTIILTAAAALLLMILFRRKKNRA